MSCNEVSIQPEGNGDVNAAIRTGSPEPLKTPGPLPAQPARQSQFVARR